MRTAIIINNDSAKERYLSAIADQLPSGSGYRLRFWLDSKVEDSKWYLLKPGTPTEPTEIQASR